LLSGYFITAKKNILMVDAQSAQRTNGTEQKILHFIYGLFMIGAWRSSVVKALTHYGMDCRPSIWAGLITLVVIELVLGIDNLVFIAILAENSLRHSVTARASPACC
jgi:hypothetical protein